jgi:hypothetical protein
MIHDIIRIPELNVFLAFSGSFTILGAKHLHRKRRTSPPFDGAVLLFNVF